MTSTKPVPQGAWDTHHHIFQPKKFPFNEGRHFTPGDATPDELQAFEKSIGVQHTCIAHGLSHGPDCTSLLHYLKEFKGSSRGICVFEPDQITDAQLNEYHAAGIRSVRLDFFKHKAMNDLDRQVALIKATSARIAAWGKAKWSIQIQQPHLNYWSTIRKLAATIPSPIVVDHMGLVSVRSLSGRDLTAEEEAGLDELRGAIREGNIWIKISAPYRCSDDEPSYSDLEKLVKSLVAANPKRVVWGSDWPHTQRHADRAGKDPSAIEPFRKVDNPAWIASLSTWLTEQEWQNLWVNNPETLYA